MAWRAGLWPTSRLLHAPALDKDADHRNQNVFAYRRLYHVHSLLSHIQHAFVYIDAVFAFAHQDVEGNECSCTTDTRAEK